MVVTYGLTGDERYAVTLPDGWGVQSIQFFEDVDCTTPSQTIEIIAATGPVTWETTPTLVPESIDVDVSLTTSVGIGRPGQHVRGSDVPVGSCG
jgi:hypothetical protein